MVCNIKMDEINCLKIDQKERVVPPQRPSKFVNGIIRLYLYLR